jgi:hypothetical protein
MNEPPLDEGIFSRATADTVSAFKTIRFYLFVLLFDALVAVLIFLIRERLYGSQDSLNIPVPMSIILAVVPLLGGSIIALTVVFLFNLIILVPYRQRNEARIYATNLLQERADAVSATPKVELSPFIGEGMAQLRVTNVGASKIKCQGQMRSVSPPPSKPKSLPYAIRWRGNSFPKSNAGLVEIVGGGDNVLQVAKQLSSNSRTKVNETLLLRSDEDDSRFRVSAEFGKEVVCEIHILCDPAVIGQNRGKYAIVIGGGGGIAGFREVKPSEEAIITN